MPARETTSSTVQDRDYDAQLALARTAFRSFLEERDHKERFVMLHDSDADGIAAAVVLTRALERAGFQNIRRVMPDRERNAWSENTRARVRLENPRALFVLDLGASREPIIENIPTCFIDHHRPEGVPPGALLISAYTWQPIPNTSLLVYDLCHDIVDVDDLDWIACLGTLSDLGERAPFEIVARAKKRYTAKWLKEATALVNAARRSSKYNPEAAARALLSASGPRSLAESTSRDVEALRAARAEVKAAMNEAKKAAPVFSGRVALVRINTPCQIHQLIAQIWRTRLPKYIVLVANEGYLPGRISFSARSAAGPNVLDFLKSIELEGEGGSDIHGHDEAAGGSLPLTRWNHLLAALGFPENAWARV